MADSFVQLPTDSTGKKIDTRTEASNSEHRQVMVIGDPSTNAGVAPVDATKGLAVDLSATGANSNKILVTPDLPSGASTAAKQPALGTAGTPSADVISVQGVTSMTALKVDGSAVTQPVSLTSTTLTGTSDVNVKQINGVTPLMGNGVTGTGSQRVTVASDNTPFAVKVDQTTPGTTNAVAATNLPTTVDTNSGNKSASTLRVVLATDQPQLTNKLLVTPDANSAVNVAQMNGVATAMGAGASSTGTQRVVLANDTGKTLAFKTGSASSSGNNTLVAAGTNKLKVYAFSLTTTSTTAITAKFQDGASGTDLWSVVLQAPTSVSVGANLAVTPPAFLFATSSATLLNLNLSSANAVQWSVAYFDEA